jgi:hypothetical protein
MKWDELNSASYNEYIELRSQMYTRLTRLYLLTGNTLAAQESAEINMKLVENELTTTLLSSTIYRWLCLSEIYFAIAIFKFISSDESDVTLKNELTFASLRHMLVACEIGNKAKTPHLFVTIAREVKSIVSTLSTEILSTPVSLLLYDLTY